MAFLYIQAVWKAVNLWRKNLSFKSALLILRYKQTLFIQVIYSCFSCYHVPTSSFDERLVLETSALKLFMVANLRFQLS